jgi:hypothetical protein
VRGVSSVRRLWFVAGLALIGLVWAGLAVAGSTSPGAPVAKRTGTGAGAPSTVRHPAAARRGKVGVGRCSSSAPAQTLTLGHKRYAREGVDTFTRAAPLGSFAQRKANAIVYVGDHGMHWTGYPDGWPSTYSGHAEGYQPSTVLSIHNGMLDFHLHNDAAGNPVGADPSPFPSGHRYQTYGAWSLCERVAPSDGRNLADFHQAVLLWPLKFHDWLRAESDYPEQDLDAFDFAGYSHYGGAGAQDIYDIKGVMSHFDTRQWHVYTQTWGPGFRSYFVDGRLVGTTTHQVWSGPERWQLQIEPLGPYGPVPNDRDSGHVYMKWVWIGRGPLR